MDEGIELFKAGHFEGALSKLDVAQNIYPQDLPLQLLITSIGGASGKERMTKGTPLLDFR
jgi:hypothetical protein